MNSKLSKKKKIIQLIWDFLVFAVLVIVDQITKYMAIDRLKGQPALKLIDGVFELQYLENRGAAFGMLQNGQVFFVFAAVVMMTAILFVLIKAPMEKKYRPWHVFLVMIAAGGIGNMIDRLRLDYVVDFFYFSLIDFPIFNVADIYVTVGTALFLIMLLFFCKEEDLNFISLSIQKKATYRDSK
ncbi:MAG: signal peptidase II [Lachnospiraceae bacterium]|nr:signal peptidase II [Lachnospiraceae bacterium]